MFIGAHCIFQMVCDDGTRDKTEIRNNDLTRINQNLYLSVNKNIKHKEYPSSSTKFNTCKFSPRGVYFLLFHLRHYFTLYFPKIMNKYRMVLPDIKSIRGALPPVPPTLSEANFYKDPPVIRPAVQGGVGGGQKRLLN